MVYSLASAVILCYSIVLCGLTVLFGGTASLGSAELTKEDAFDTGESVCYLPVSESARLAVTACAATSVVD